MHRFRKYLLIAGLLVLAIVAFNQLVRAAVSDYEYVVTVAIDNQGSALADTPVAITMNPSALISQSFLQADAEDWFPADVSQAELQGVAQGMGTTSAPWWVDITQSAGSMSLYSFYMGDSTATRDQRFRFDGTTDTLTVTDHVDLDITDDLLIEATIELVVWPAATGTAYVIRKEGAYEIEIGWFAEVEAITGTVTSVGDSQSVVTVGGEWTAGVEYDIALYYDKDAASDNLKIYVDDIERNAEDFTDSLASTATHVVIGSGFNGYIDALYIDPPIIRENYITGDDDSATTVFGSKYLAQTFTAEETYYVTSFRLKLLAVDSPTNAKLRLYSVSDGYPDASLIPVITVDVSSASTSTPAWITFPLSSPYEIQSGSEYAIQLRNSSTAAGEITWQADSSSPTYTGGRALKSNAGASVWYSGFASVTTIDEQVAADGDDFSLQDDQADGETEYSQPAIRIGHSENGSHHHYSAGARFTSVAIPSTNAQIIETYLTVTPSGTRTENMVSRFYGEDADNPLTYSTAADFAARTRTTAYVSYTGAKTWTKDVELDLSSMPLVAQEIADRPGWTLNNAMAFFIDQTGGSGLTSIQEGYEYETSSPDAFQLHLEYVDDDDATGDFMFEAWGLGGSANKVAFDFEPDEIESTQVGNSGNSWVWTGTVTDVSTGGSDHDGTYSLTRDLSDVRVWLYSLEATEAPTIDPTPTPVDSMGAITLTPVATLDEIDFLFREQLVDVLEHADIGIIPMAAWFVFLTGLGLVLSVGVWTATKSAFLVAIPLPVTYWIGYALGTPIPLWLPLVFTFVSIGAAYGLSKITE